MITHTGLAMAAAAVVLLIAGLLSGYEELAVLGATAAVSLGLAGLWMLFRPQLDATRHISPQRVSVGTPAYGHLAVANTGGRRSAPLVAEEGFGRQPILVPLPSLARGANHTADYELPTGRRGIYEVGPLRIGHADPLRLMRVSQERGEVRSLWVYPEVQPMVPLPAGRNRDLDGPTSGVAPEGGVAFHTLREYVVGDDLRLIHWRSSARAGKLMVRHNVDTNQPRVLVLLETRPDCYSGDEDFEEAVSVAASIASGSVSRHFPMQVRTTGGQAASAGIGAGPQAVLDLLAAVRLDPAGSVLDSIGASGVEAGSSLAYVTGRATDRDIGAISNLRRFELRCVCQLGDDPNAGASSIPGAVTLAAARAHDLARLWNARFRR